MSVKKSLLLFLNLSLVLPLYASTFDGDEKYHKRVNISLKSLSSNKRKEDKELKKYADDLEEILEEDSKKRKVSGFFYDTHPLFYTGIKDSLIEVLAQGEDIETSLKGLHNFLIISKQLDTVEHWKKAISLVKGSLFNVNFLRQKVDPLHRELFSNLSLDKNPNGLRDLRINFRFYCNKLFDQLKNLYWLEPTELAQIIIQPKIGIVFQNIALNQLLKKFLEGRNDYKQRRLHSIKPSIIEKISSDTLDGVELSNIIKAFCFDEDVKKKAVEELIKKNKNYKSYSLEQLLMICENLNYGNSTIKDVNDVICEKLKNSDHTLSSSVLIDFSLRHNMPRPIKTLLITSVPSSIKTPQDVEDLISKLDKMYSVNSTMKYYKDLIKKIFSPDLVEIITPHLAKVKLYFLKSFQNLVKPDLISARIYPQINASLETAIHEAEKAMIAELVPIKQLLKLNNEWFPVGIKHNISS